MQKAANSKIHLRQQLFRLLRNQEGDISLNITQEDQRDRLIACDIANKIRKAPKADVDTSYFDAFRMAAANSLRPQNVD